ncbi:retrovirus-related pol polyprotein from transposon TNT 1-94 [Tanacetum coccineum]
MLLHKSLYDLKQAPRAWFERLSKALFDLGFKGSKTDPFLFIYLRGDTLLYILVYVDGIIVIDLGHCNYFLGIEIVPHVSGILLSQKKYILELLQSAGLSNCNLMSFPMVTSSSLSLDDSTAFSNPVKYRQVEGSLEYVTPSRHDIAFSVNKLNMVCSYVVLLVLPFKLLLTCNGKVIPILLLKLSQMLTGLEIQMIDGLRGGGFAIYLSSNLISWTTRKQRTVSRYSTEAEYKALADTVAKLTWLQALLNELGIRSSSTTYLSANPIFHARTKHIEIDYHFVWEKVA